jgi:hypothetical protein
MSRQWIGSGSGCDASLLPKAASLAKFQTLLFYFISIVVLLLFIFLLILTCQNLE